MNVKQLLRTLESFPDDAEVRIGITWPDRVTESYERLVVSDYGGGPMLTAALDFKGLRVYVGCSLHQKVAENPAMTIDLGQYDNLDTAAKVRDFYVVHRGLKEPLNYPDFDYETWIPPRTTSGEYNPNIAAILREKLLRD